MAFYGDGKHSDGRDSEVTLHQKKTLKTRAGKRRVFTANTCDAWHGHDSMEKLGIYNTHTNAVAACKRHYLKTNKARMPKALVIELMEQRQTHGQEENYYIMVDELNKDDF